MKRLVYAPKVYAYVKTDSGTYDLTEYLTAGEVTRKLDQISSAKLTLRNPYMFWTDLKTRDPVSGETLTEPVFHPMDPITIIMERLQNRPVQVFTGYLDTTPYMVLRPGTVTLQASCTLKKLQYTYFDAGLPFFEEFMAQQGWGVLEGGSIINTGEPAQGENAKEKGSLTDTGFGQLLLSTLEDIGGWPSSTLYIEEIPPGLIELVTGLFETQAKYSEEANKELIKLLHKIIGTAALGEGELSTGTGKADGGEEGIKATAGGWVKVGATEEGPVGNPENTAGGGPGGMCFAELLIAGENADLKSEALFNVLNIKEGPEGYGMAFNTPIEIRLPGSNKAYTMYKNDNGSGQGGDPHFKVDLQTGIINALGWSGNQDVEVRVPQ